MAAALFAGIRFSWLLGSSWRPACAINCRRRPIAFSLRASSGFGWSPDKKSKWVLHLRSGIFMIPIARVDLGCVPNEWCAAATKNDLLAKLYGPPHTDRRFDCDQHNSRFPHYMVQKSILTVYANVEHDFPQRCGEVVTCGLDAGQCRVVLWSVQLPFKFSVSSTRWFDRRGIQTLRQEPMRT